MFLLYVIVFAALYANTSYRGDVTCLVETAWTSDECEAFVERIAREVMCGDWTPSAGGYCNVSSRCEWLSNRAALARMASLNVAYVGNPPYCTQTRPSY